MAKRMKSEGKVSSDTHQGPIAPTPLRNVAHYARKLRKYTGIAPNAVQGGLSAALFNYLSGKATNADLATLANAPPKAQAVLQEALASQNVPMPGAPSGPITGSVGRAPSGNQWIDLMRRGYTPQRATAPAIPPVPTAPTGQPTLPGNIPPNTPVPVGPNTPMGSGLEGTLTPFPSPSGFPTWWNQTMPTTRPESVSLQDYMQQAITNQMIPYMGDPRTQRETAQWLARDNPMQYGGYAGVNVNPPGFPGETIPANYNITPAQVAQMVTALGEAPLKQRLPTAIIEELSGRVPAAMTQGKNYTKDELKAMAEENKAASLDVQSGVNWLKEYLKTALGGMPGSNATRAQQQYTAGHLQTLMKEAEGEPYKAGAYSTLAENLINPIIQRAPLSGTFGFSRALNLPSGQFRRKGVGFRNPALT